MQCIQIQNSPFKINQLSKNVIVLIVSETPTRLILRRREGIDTPIVGVVTGIHGRTDRTEL